MTLQQEIHSGRPQLAAQHPIPGGGSAAPRDVAEDAHTVVGAQTHPHLLGYAERAARKTTLGNNDDTTSPPVLEAALDALAQHFNVRGVFRQQDVISAAGDPDLQGDGSAGVPHDLDEEEPLEGLGRVPDAIYGVQGDVDGGVEAQGVVGACQVVVYGAGDADDTEVVLSSQG